MRQWPEGVGKKGVTAEFAKVYREAFDADLAATFCAGEIDGVLIVVARVGTWVAEEIERCVIQDLDGVIQRKSKP